MAPKPKVTASTAQTKRLPRSDHSSVAISIEISTSAPPMVGVPALVRCDFGPSSRTDWPILEAVSLRITSGPVSNDIASAVRQASTARNVM